MKKTLIAVVVLLALGLAFAAGSWVTWRSVNGSRQAADAKVVLHYTCPMHPAYHSDRIGDCPTCGMRLVPVHAGGSGGSSLAPADASRLIRVSAERQQVIGVKLGVAEQSSGRQTLRTVGRIAVDETRTYRITAAVDGWVQQVKANSAGMIVAKDEVLATYYGPEFLGAQQGYVFALASLDRFQRGKETPDQLRISELSIKQAADGLRNLGMSERQLAEISGNRQIQEHIWITSPAPGVVLARGVSPGQRFEKGTELYRIANLARVWVFADLFESQAEYVAPGVVARVTTRQRQREYQARVSNVQALFDAATGTLKVRLETDNPGYTLKPGMFVDVDFPVSYPPALTVPADAVLDSGLRKIVFVDRGNGYFEPRRVETGWRVGERMQVVKGLMAGERVVVSGNFLLDSESRMKAALAATAATDTDPVCGMDVDRVAASKAGRTAVHDGRTSYFCSDDCLHRFKADPAKFSAR